MEVPCGYWFPRNVRGRAMGASVGTGFHETSADAPWARPYQMDCAFYVLVERHVKVSLHKGGKAREDRSENTGTEVRLPARLPSRLIGLTKNDRAR